jgi:ATP-dependent helicase HrpB
MAHLPVDTILPQLLDALHHHPAVVLLAPPGSGKTTRVPLALLRSPWLQESRIVMLEPRRLAATNAARWMAGRLGEEVGKTVGYQIRFEKKVSAATRIEVVTEGILTRRLHSDPTLSGVGVVIFDEFHERSLQADLALALCRDVQLGLREDLKIIVMSATLDPGPISALLDQAPVIGCEGRSYPVAVRYLGGEGRIDPARETARAVCQALRETDGDMLVFLPGAGEIRRCQTLLHECLGADAPLICPLYGDLPFAAQERAIMPAGRRKVVLATNIAETSLTIEGVKVVIDSGWCRRLRFDAGRGLNRLVTERVSAASAVQRAGRAGRLGPGACYRLWTEHQQRTLLPFYPPEIQTADLAPLALDLALWGVGDAASLHWLDPPPPAALAEGRKLLLRLGGVDSRGHITTIGRRMAELPLHPRLAHLLLLAVDRGEGPLGCDLAALLSERDVLRNAPGAGAGHVSASDLLDRLDALASWRRSAGAGGVATYDRSACRSVDRVARQLRATLGIAADPQPPTAEGVGRLLSQAYPDRIARQRAPESDRYLLANGLGGRLAPQCAVRNRPFIVAVSLEGEEGGDGLIRQASSVELPDLRQEFGAFIERRRVVAWDEGEGRVVAREEERFGALLLGTRAITPDKEEIREAFLQGIAAGPGLTACAWSSQALQFVARVRFLSRQFPGEWPDLSVERLNADLPQWLGPFVPGVRSRAELARTDILPALRALLSWEQGRRLDEGAPTQITVPSGSRIRVDYLPEEGPVLAVKLQELFGLGDTPCVAWGRVPLLLHLLSPAGRPMQVTRDLRNFWNMVYPQVKKELKGRYPKHPWPDDPWNAAPTRHAKRRGV